MIAVAKFFPKIQNQSVNSSEIEKSSTKPIGE